jgi:putative hydrolase of the HAD superfamily
MATKAIIFDMWNTIAYNKGAKVNPIIKLQQILGLNIRLYREVELGIMAKKFKSREEAMKNLCKQVGVKPDDRIVNNLVDVWRGLDINVTFFPDAIPTITKLREKYKIGILSNTDCFTVQEFREKGYDKYFDGIAFSCELELLKPDPKIFNFLLNELGVKPEEAVMVGDNYKDDVLAAQKVGMRGILLKRNYEKYHAKPSYVETGHSDRVIKDLTELEKLL